MKEKEVTPQILIIQYFLADPHHLPVEAFCFLHLFLKSNVPLRDCGSRDISNSTVVKDFNG